MNKVFYIFLLPALILLGFAGGYFYAKNGEASLNNPAVYFEIPVKDLDRATKFYAAVFGFDFTREEIHGNEMAFFPYDPSAPGITGGLAKGEIYKPSKEGALVYFGTPDIDQTIAKIRAAGGRELFAKTRAGEYGFVAEFEDSEGNRIGLSQK